MTDLDLNHSVSLVVGVANGDYGHKQHERFFFDMNRPNGYVRAAFQRAARNYSIDITQLCRDYQDDVLPTKEARVLKMLFQNDPDALAHVVSIEQDCDGHMSTDDFVHLYLFIARIEDPELRWAETTDQSINLGGYGLFE